MGGAYVFISTRMCLYVPMQEVDKITRTPPNISNTMPFAFSDTDGSFSSECQNLSYNSWTICREMLDYLSNWKRSRLKVMEEVESYGTLVILEAVQGWSNVGFSDNTCEWGWFALEHEKIMRQRQHWCWTAASVCCGLKVSAGFFKACSDLGKLIHDSHILLIFCIF